MEHFVKDIDAHISDHERQHESSRCPNYTVTDQVIECQRCQHGNIRRSAVIQCTSRVAQSTIIRELYQCDHAIVHSQLHIQKSKHLRQKLQAYGYEVSPERRLVHVIGRTILVKEMAKP